MASTINASSTGSGGLITTGDASGQLALQANGVTQATVSSTGLAMASNQTLNTANTFGFKNRIINGAMTIDQRNAGASVAFTDNIYTLDRWVSIKASSAVGTVQQLSATPPSNFKNYLRATCTTGSTPSAAQYNMLWQKIEGNNIWDIGLGTSAAKPFAVSFWVRSSLTGTFAAAVFNGTTYANGYTFNYTISAANTWTYVTVSIPAQTAGTWETGTSTCLTIEFDLGCGSNSAGTPNVWGSVYYTTSGATQVMATTGATWDVTGVQLEVGSQATSFDFRSIGQEYLLCQRYYQRITPNTNGNAGDGGFLTMANWVTTSSYGGYVFPIPMRTGPSGSYSALSDFAYLSNGAGRTPTSLDLSNNSATRVEVLAAFGTGGTAGYAGWMRISAGGWLAFSAEL